VTTAAPDVVVPPEFVALQTYSPEFSSCVEAITVSKVTNEPTRVPSILFPR